MQENHIDENDDLQKAIDGINKNDEQGGEEGFAAGMAAKFAEQMKAVPDAEANEFESINNNVGGGVENSELVEVKHAAMRDLVPLMDKLEVSTEDKFALYVEMFEVLDDKSVASKMHEAARAMADEGRKAKALLKVIRLLKSF